MFIQDNLRNLKAVFRDGFSILKFLIMFTGVVVGPLVLFAVGGRVSNTLWESGLAWTLLAIALLLIVSLGVGLSMFKREARDLSISPKYMRK